MELKEVAAGILMDSVVYTHVKLQFRFFSIPFVLNHEAWYWATNDSIKQKTDENTPLAKWEMFVAESRNGP